MTRVMLSIVCYPQFTTTDVPFLCSTYCQVYRIFGQTVVFYPTDSMADFYTSFDVMILIDTLKVLAAMSHNTLLILTTESTLNPDLQYVHRHQTHVEYVVLVSE